MRNIPWLFEKPVQLDTRWFFFLFPFENLKQIVGEENDYTNEEVRIKRIHTNEFKSAESFKLTKFCFSNSPSYN